MPNPILEWLKGGRPTTSPPAPQPAERKLYYWPTPITPAAPGDPNVLGAIRMGMLVHGPGATDLTYQAYHYNDANSAVYACLSAISTAFPEAPTRVYRETEPGDRDVLVGHPCQALLDKPNPVHTRMELWHYTQWCKHVSGNAFWRKVRAGDRRGGNVVELWPISPLLIVPITTKQDAAKGVFISYYEYSYDPAKDPEKIPPQDIVHFRLGIDDRDNRVGCSPLAKLIREISGDEYAHAWQTSMLSNGGAAGMVVQVPAETTMSSDEAELLKQSLSERFGGQNVGKVGVLTGGATMSPYGFSPEQMDMRSLHRIPEERIAAVLRVPAIIAGLGAGLDRSTYSNYREAREMFAEMTILPLYQFDAAVLNNQLLPEFNSDPKVSIQFDITDLRALQEDEDGKWKRLNEAVKTGWVQPSEARVDVGLPADMPEVQQLPGAAAAGPPLPPGAEDEPEDETKARGRPNPEAIGKLPDLIQAFADSLEPGFEQQLDTYFDQQRKRVKRELLA